MDTSFPIGIIETKATLLDEEEAELNESPRDRSRSLTGALACWCLGTRCSRGGRYAPRYKSSGIRSDRRTQGSLLISTRESSITNPSLRVAGAVVGVALAGHSLWIFEGSNEQACGSACSAA